MKHINIYIALLLMATLMSCSDKINIDKTLSEAPDIYPDYDGVTIPTNIAPLNFKLKKAVSESVLFLKTNATTLEVKGQNGKFKISPSKWKKLLMEAIGSSIEATVCIRENNYWVAYAPFNIYVASEEVDPYLAYRLIVPGYELWNKMGIYQRNLTDFEQTAIYENKATSNNCVNCHSFCMQDPGKMLFHMREKLPGTILIDGNRIEKLNTKTPQTISALVYPSWHPSGKYVAFSTNNTKQAFHQNDRNRVEVYDEESDVVVYDVEKHEIVTTPSIFSKNSYETFPAFSPDGKTLYFCTAEARPIPQEYDKIKYSICSVEFDPSTRSFGNKIDTLFDARKNDKSASFPRVSPDGKYLLYTLSGYGNFSIWHKDADLYLIDLKTKISTPLTEVNSDDVESYHSWSSNSRWFVFSSRRKDGLYTHPYIAHIDKQGKIGKPFMLPQEDPDFYDSFMQSFNIPEFVKGKIKRQQRRIALTAKEEKGIDVKFIE